MASGKVCSDIGFAKSKYRKPPGLIGKDIAFSKRLALERLLEKKRKREEKKKEAMDELNGY